MALHVHNELRRLHNAPAMRLEIKVSGILNCYHFSFLIQPTFFIKLLHRFIFQQLCRAAQKLAHLIAFKQEAVQNSNPPFELDSSESFSNVEMNWYFQNPTNNDFETVVSNAIQAWYQKGKTVYNFGNVAQNLSNETALTFSRVVWKRNTHLGVGVVNLNIASFVVCVYVPGRNIKSINPTEEFSLNVTP